MVFAGAGVSMGTPATPPNLGPTEEQGHNVTDGPPTPLPGRVRRRGLYRAVSVLLDTFRHIQDHRRMSRTRSDEILELVREAGLVRPRDLESAGLSGGSLAQLARRGLLARVGRGLYAVPSAVPSEHRSLAEVSKRTPRGVICLLSALRFHGLTTQAPPEVG